MEAQTLTNGWTSDIGKVHKMYAGKTTLCNQITAVILKAVARVSVPEYAITRVLVKSKYGDCHEYGDPQPP